MQWRSATTDADMMRGTGDDEISYATGWTISGLATLGTIVGALGICDLTHDPDPKGRASAGGGFSSRQKRNAFVRKQARSLRRWCSAKRRCPFTLATVVSAGRTFSSQVASLRLTDCCCRVCLLAVGAGERHAPRNCLPCCRLPPDARRHAANQQSCGFSESRALARRGLPRTALIWLAEVLTGRTTDPRPGYPRTLSTAFERPRVNQARPILRPGGRQASGPLRLQPLEPGARGFHRPSGAGRLGRA